MQVAGADAAAEAPSDGWSGLADIQLYDATLRDGMQGEGMSLSAAEKLRVAHGLDALGIDLIEAGFPASNPKERELFELLGARDASGTRRSSPSA